MGRTGLRIAVIGLRGFPSNYSGMERASEELYPALAARGHKITVFTRTRSDHPSANDCGVCIIDRPAFRWAPAETISHSVASMLAIFRSRVFDIVHLHALAPGLTSWAYRLQNVPTVITVHGLDWQRARWRGTGSFVLRLAEQVSVRCADAMIVVSNELREYYGRRYGRCTRLVYNAIDFSEQNRPGDRGILDSWQLTNSPYISSIGRLVPEKRIEDLIRAFREVSFAGRLVIVGDGPSAYVRRLRHCCDGDPRILFLGTQGRPQIRELLRDSRAFVSASEMEGFPLALIECVAQGVPAIVTDIAPHRELFAHASGYDLMFAVGDLSRLASLMQRVVDSATIERHRAVERARCVERAFPVARMVDETEEVFFDVARQYESRRRVP